MKETTFLILTILSLILFSSTSAKGQYYIEWEDEDVDEFYIKESVKSGTLSEDGKEISFILVLSSISIFPFVYLGAVQSKRGPIT